MPWIREGDCPPERCKGQCCDHLGIWFEVTASNSVFFDALTVRGLKISGMDNRALIQIPQRCQHLTDDGLCGIYDRRPEFCRRWPEEPAQQILTPDCGYSFVWAEEG